MPKCKNDPNRNYQGTEPSPKGFGWCAHAEKAGTVRKGKDGNMWIVKKVKGGSKRWIIHNNVDKEMKNITNYLGNKFYKWWYKLSTGSILIIYRDGKYKIYESKKKTRSARIKDIVKYHRDISKDATVVAIVWSSMSTDSLTHFMYYIFEKLPNKMVEELLLSKNPLDIIVKNYKIFFEKYKLETDKDYIFKRHINVDYDKIFNKLKKSKKITQFLHKKL